MLMEGFKTHVRYLDLGYKCDPAKRAAATGDARGTEIRLIDCSKGFYDERGGYR